MRKLGGKLGVLAVVGLVTLAGLAAHPRSADAYIVEALTSIPVDPAADKESVVKAIMAAVDDVATHAVAFRPAVVSLRDAKLIGGRIYLFVLIADEAGQAEIEVLETGGSQTQVERY
jgi:hypothetical protein